MSIVARFERNLHRVLLGGVLALAVALPTLGQPSADEQWVATWATALVARPVAAGDAAREAPRRRTSCGRPFGASAAGRCTAAPAAAA